MTTLCSSGVRNGTKRIDCGLALRLAFVAGVIGVGAHTPAAAADKAPVKVSAYYKIAFSGINIGHFRFDSNIAKNRYELVGSSGVKLLFGAFRFSSQARTTGQLRRGPSPEEFRLEYWIKKKQKQTRVQFARGNVIDLTNIPRVNYSAKYVPIEPAHLKGVVDPMTAIMQMSQNAKGNPCRKSAEVFDGRRRLRIKLTPKGRRRIFERKPSGQPGFGYVCGIRFTPIAGHKKSEQIDFLSKSKGIEVVLRPVPSAAMVVPYTIEIPTAFGTISMAAKLINILDGGSQRIAMRF